MSRECLPSNGTTGAANSPSRPPTPVAGRTEAELDALVGFFINILVLRNDLSGDPTLREILVRSRDTALAAYAHQDLPFDHVVDAVSPARSLSRNPLFGVVVHVRED